MNNVDRSSTRVRPLAEVDQAPCESPVTAADAPTSHYDPVQADTPTNMLPGSAMDGAAVDLGLLSASSGATAAPAIVPGSVAALDLAVVSALNAADLKPAPQMAPKRIGRFCIIRTLGFGGFGTVYLAHDEDLDRRVALKVPRRERLNSEETVSHFLGEARKAAKLKHPSIVTVYDASRAPDGTVFVVMELVEGRTLCDRLTGAPLTPVQAAELIAEVADAVHYAHKQGLVHRDLKPANILLDADGRPHVADFGLAVHEDEQRDHAGEISGSAPYMAPDQVRGDVHRHDGRVDIWALGVILYRLLTGRLPFGGKTTAQILDEVLHRDPKPPRQIDDKIPVELERICLKCLAKPVAERYSTAADLATELRRAVGAPATSAPSHAMGKRMQLALLVAAAMVLVVLGVWTWAVTRQTPQQAANASAQALGDPLASLEADFHVLRFKGQNGPLVGEISQANPNAEVNDGAGVVITLSRPAYCFLLALNPDGSVQLCDPANDSATPERTSRIDFPRSANEDFGLTDGPGLQAFTLIASDKPLPPYRQWRLHLDNIPWKHVPDATEPWSYDGGRLVPLGTRQRGTLRERTPPPFAEACDYLSRLPGVAKVHAAAFPVMAQSAEPTSDGS